MVLAGHRRQQRGVPAEAVVKYPTRTAARKPKRSGTKITVLCVYCRKARKNGPCGVHIGATLSCVYARNFRAPRSTNLRAWAAIRRVVSREQWSMAELADAVKRTRVPPRHGENHVDYDAVKRTLGGTWRLKQ